MENPIINVILFLITTSFVFSLIGLWINAFASGYKSLEHKNTPFFKNILEGFAGFFKIFKS